MLSDKKIVIINNQNNLEITKKDVENISKSKHFIGSDGGMTHIARSLNILHLQYFLEVEIQFMKKLFVHPLIIKFKIYVLLNKN